jgi:hypothetical protein
VTKARARGPKDRGEPVDLVDLIDDETVEALVAGRPVDARFDHLAAFTHEARALSDRPPPKPSAALAAYVARGRAPPAPAATTPLRPRRRHAVARSVAGLGLAAQIAIGASVGAFGVAAAGAAGVLPEPTNREVRHLIEAATPIEFPEPADGAPAGEGAPTIEGPDPTRPSRPVGQDERGNRGGRAPMAASRPAEHQPADGAPGGEGAPTIEGADPTRPSRPVGQDERGGEAAAPAEPASDGAGAPATEPAEPEPVDQEGRASAAVTEPAEREPVDQEGRAPVAVTEPDESELPSPDAQPTSSTHERPIHVDAPCPQDAARGARTTVRGSGGCVRVSTDPGASVRGSRPGGSFGAAPTTTAAAPATPTNGLTSRR